MAVGIGVCCRLIYSLSSNHPQRSKKYVAYSTKYSQEVTLPSTSLAQCCLTSGIWRELVLSTRYGSRHDKMFLEINTFCPQTTFESSYDLAWIWYAVRESLTYCTTQAMTCPIRSSVRTSSNHQWSKTLDFRSFSCSGQVMYLIIMAEQGHQFQTRNESIILQKWSCEV